MKSRNGSISSFALLAGIIALTLMGASHQSSCETARRVQMLRSRAQLALLRESAGRATEGAGLTAPIHIIEPHWDLEVAAGPGARVAAKWIP